MKLSKIKIHNFRSVTEQTVYLRDYSLLVGSNNAGKSTVINALRAFYNKIKLDQKDSHCGKEGTEISIECTYDLDESELLQQKKVDLVGNQLVIRRTLFPSDRKKVPGRLIYIPASSSVDEHIKLSGPSEFRELLHDLMESVSTTDTKYKGIETALSAFSNSVSEEGGALNRIVAPLNHALKNWQVSVGMKVRPLTPEEICKLLVSFTFIDQNVEGEVDLGKFGNGLQRTVIYEMIRLIAQIESENNGLESQYKLIVFEEPENFLHPHQQEILAYSLRRLGSLPNQQVVITTHSPIFPGRSKDDLKRIIRLTKDKAVTNVFQFTDKTYEVFLGDGLGFIKCLQDFVNDDKVDDISKKKARELIANPPEEEIAQQEQEFRLQLALDGERCSMFFAEHVVMVEGATEKALLEVLLREKWIDIQNRRLYILDVMGKYNYHYFLSLFENLGLSHSILLDDDHDKNEHVAFNAFIDSRSNEFTLGGKACRLSGDIETFLGLGKIPAGKSHRKPLEMLKAYYGGKITDTNLLKLRTLFESRLIPN